MKDRLKKLSELLDINKRYPGYANKIVFRSALFVIILISLFILGENGLESKFSVSCPANANIPCENPLYTCSDPMAVTYMTTQLPDSFCKYCDTIPCDKPYLQPGEQYGEKASPLYRYYTLIVLLIVLVAAAINHNIYMMRMRA